MDQTEKQDQRAAILGEIILSSRKVESFLHKLCGSTEVAGIHALTELLGSKLPDELKRKLHYIATVRNHAAHEDTFELSAEDFAGYKRVVEETLTGLQAIFPEKTAENNTADNEKPHTAADLAVSVNSLNAYPTDYRCWAICRQSAIYTQHICCFIQCLNRDTCCC